MISEVSDNASAAYILPADKTASVFEGAVTKVEMHNELRDTPKTGDDSNPALWLSLLGISAVGAAILGVIGWKKKKTENDRCNRTGCVHCGRFDFPENQR